MSAPPQPGRVGFVRRNLPPQMREIYQLAAKYVSKRAYKCLVPGCHRHAISSHAIPRALLVEALAEKGHVYSQEMSTFASVIRGRKASDPIYVERVGVNQATVFKGYCPRHDHMLFAPIEVKGANLRRSLVHALHLRAISLEYCRNRWVADFERRIDELAVAKGFASRIGRSRTDITYIRDGTKSTLDYMFEHHRLSVREGVTYHVFPFKRNLEVSCCGLTSHHFAGRVAHIGYNLLSFRDMTMLTLTTFFSAKLVLDAFIGTYGFPSNVDLEQLVNDIAFTKGEEPAISPRLWEALSTEQQLQICESLRPPWVRATNFAPRIISLKAADDHVAVITSEMWTRFLSGFSAPSQNRLSV